MVEHSIWKRSQFSLFICIDTSRFINRWNVYWNSESRNQHLNVTDDDVDDCEKRMTEIVGNNGMRKMWIYWIDIMLWVDELTGHVQCMFHLSLIKPSNNVLGKLEHFCYTLKTTTYINSSMWIMCRTIEETTKVKKYAIIGLLKNIDSKKHGLASIKRCTFYFLSCLSYANTILRVLYSILLILSLLLISCIKFWFML